MQQGRQHARENDQARIVFAENGKAGGEAKEDAPRRTAALDRRQERHRDQRPERQLKRVVIEQRNAKREDRHQAQQRDRRDPAPMIDDESGGEPYEPHSERGIEECQKVERPPGGRHHRKPCGRHPIDQRRKLEIADRWLTRQGERLRHIEVDRAPQVPERGRNGPHGGIGEQEDDDAAAACWRAPQTSYQLDHEGAQRSRKPLPEGAQRERWGSTLVRRPGPA